jgi:NADPH:quinone reductase-like Zn-dependent oxidoreductase
MTRMDIISRSSRCRNSTRISGKFVYFIPLDLADAGCGTTEGYGQRQRGRLPFRVANYQTLMSLAESAVLKPVIDSVLPFEQIAEAHCRVDGAHKVGSLVLTFGEHG